jgi:hypothetical protein
VATSQGDSLIRLASTSEIIWLDERYNRRPVLAFKHHREYDRTLQAFVVEYDSSELMLLFLSS